MTTHPSVSTLDNVRAIASTRAIFFYAGLATAAWAAIIPLIKITISIGDEILGLLLLCLGVGAIVAMPLTGAVATRWGCKLVLLLTVTLFSIVLILLPLATTTLQLALLLTVFGFGIGATDCVMNIQAILVEKRTDRNLMSGFHGFYSLGGIVGAGLMAALLTSGISALQACLMICLFIIGTLCHTHRGLLPFSAPKEGPSFALPHGPVLLIDRPLKCGPWLI